MTRSSVSPWVTWGLYLFAVVLVLSPLMDLTSTVWPFRPGEMAWRYGFLGLLPGYVHTPILGVVLCMAVAYWQGHPLILRSAGIVSTLAALLLFLGMATFAVDVLQMRELRAPQEQTGVLVGGILQEVKYVTAAIVLLLIGIGGAGTAREFRTSRRHAGSGAGIVGRG